jgi:hypothetical protein
MTAYLIDRDSSEQYEVTEPLCKIGSAANNNIVLDAPDVQPVHVRVELKNGAYWAALEPGASNMRKFLFFFDIPSAKYNGAVLRGQAQKLSDGDQLQVGSRLLEFRAV